MYCVPGYQHSQMKAGCMGLSIPHLIGQLNLTCKWWGAMESSAGQGKKTIKMAQNNACRKKIIVQLQTAHKNAGF